MSDTAVYTIGYGARSIEEFIRALRANGITYLIDVRSRPYSRYKPEFSQEALDSQLQAHQIRYVFMGDTLGGQPDDPDCYTDGKVDYEKCHQEPFFLAGIGRLRRAWEQKTAGSHHVQRRQAGKLPSQQTHRPGADGAGHHRHPHRRK